MSSVTLARLGLLVLAIGFVIFAVVGCYTGQRVDEAGGAPLGGLRYLHDAEHKVSCWTIADGSISCLPDSEVNR